MTVVEQVAEGCATRGNHNGQATSGGRRNFLKLSSIQIPQEQRALCPSGSPILFVHPGIYVAVGNENIEQAVFVVVQKTGSPPEERDGEGSNSCAKGHIRKCRFSVVAIERVVIIREVGNVKVDLPVAVVIAHGDPHGSLLAPFVIQGKS